jgi:hypothetical protein
MHLWPVGAGLRPSVHASVCRGPPTGDRSPGARTRRAAAAGRHRHRRRPAAAPSRRAGGRSGSQPGDAAACPRAPRARKRGRAADPGRCPGAAVARWRVRCCIAQPDRERGSRWGRVSPRDGQSAAAFGKDCDLRQVPARRRPAGIIRRLLNAGARWFGTDINRRLSDILADSRCVVERNLPSLARGVYRVVVVKPLLSA